jgi:hypothetical protein
MCAVFNNKTYPRLHFIFTRSYPVLMFVGLLFMGTVFGVYSLLIIAFTIIGLLAFYLVKNDTYAELWLISGLTIWGLVFYIFI